MSSDKIYICTSANRLSVSHRRSLTATSDKIITLTFTPFLQYNMMDNLNIFEDAEEEEDR